MQQIFKWMEVYNCVTKQLDYCEMKDTLFGWD